MIINSRLRYAANRYRIQNMERLDEARTTARSTATPAGVRRTLVGDHGSTNEKTNGSSNPVVI